MAPVMIRARTRPRYDRKGVHQDLEGDTRTFKIIFRINIADVTISNVESAMYMLPYCRCEVRSRQAICKRGMTITKLKVNHFNTLPRCPHLAQLAL
jgi:hypothetical protein